MSVNRKSSVKKKKEEAKEQMSVKRKSETDDTPEVSEEEEEEEEEDIEEFFRELQENRPKKFFRNTDDDSETEQIEVDVIDVIPNHQSKTSSTTLQQLHPNPISYTHSLPPPAYVTYSNSHKILLDDED
jgi:hypothetical protein